MKLENQFQARKLKDTQEVFLGKKSLEISLEERKTWNDKHFIAPFLKMTIFFSPNTYLCRNIKFIKPYTC